MLDKIIIGVISGGLGGGLGGLIVSFFNYRFNRKLESVKREQLIKDKAAIVAELFAKLEHYLSFQEHGEFECTKLSYELSLYLPADIYKLISQRLINDPTSLSTRELLIKVREHLMEQKDELTANHIVTFLPGSFIPPKN